MLMGFLIVLGIIIGGSVGFFLGKNGLMGLCIGMIWMAVIIFLIYKVGN